VKQAKKSIAGMSSLLMGISNRTITIIVVAILAVALLVSLTPILTPFLVAAFFAYLMDPVADKLTGKRINRTMAVSIIFVVMSLVMVLLVLLIVPMLFRQLISFIHTLPAYMALLQAYALPELQKMGIHIEAIPMENVKVLVQDNWQKAGGLLTQIIQGATASTMSLVAFFANLIVIPVVAFYLLRDWSNLLGFIRETLPNIWRDKVMALAAQCDEVLSSFIRGQLMVMASLAVIYSIGLSIIGVDLALFLGTLAGLASVVPYLGAIVGIGASALVAYMQFQEIMPIVYVCIVFGVGQIIESMFLTPVLVGDKIGLHPVAVIFAIMAGGQLAGFVGVLIALPVAAVLMVFIRHFHQKYKASQLYLHIDDE
jgi:predicted PurR-regulated permease PerM